MGAIANDWLEPLKIVPQAVKAKTDSTMNFLFISQTSLILVKQKPAFYKKAGGCSETV